MAESGQLGALSSGLSRAWSWLLVENVTLQSFSWTIFGRALKPANSTRIPVGEEGRETRTYECVCGHSERINVASGLVSPS